MKTGAELDAEALVWGPYASYEDIARFEYGQLLWKSPAMKARLLKHWMDERHPYRDRFTQQRKIIEEVLNSTESIAKLDASLRLRGYSLRGIAREIPPVFGSFF